MARLYICKGRCGKKLPIDELQVISGQNFCSECYEKIITEKRDRKELHDTIRRLYNIDMPTGQMLRQIKLYEENNLTLKGMTLTLEFCKDVKKMSFHPKYGLSLISYYYAEAKENYINKHRRTENHKDTEIKTETVFITSIRKNKYKQKKLINLEEII